MLRVRDCEPGRLVPSHVAARLPVHGLHWLQSPCTQSIGGVGVVVQASDVQDTCLVAPSNAEHSLPVPTFAVVTS